MTSHTNDGVFEFDLPKSDGNQYARIGQTFFFTDHMHTYFVAKGQRPAFPDKEDLPRNAASSFDNYYIPVRGRDGVSVHRVTLERSNVFLASEERSCFVDGNLVYSTKVVGRNNRVRIFLYNTKEWKSSAYKSRMPYFWFEIEGTKITVIANYYMKHNDTLWKSWLRRSPDHYEIFIGEPAMSLKTGAPLEAPGYKMCPYTAYLVLLWPVYILWILFLTLVWTPIQYFARKCVVRDYLVTWSIELGRWDCKEVDKTTLANPVLMV